MTHVGKQTFDLIVEWLQEANNYAGIGSHDVDGTSHYMKVNGQSKHAARHTWDDYSGKEIWLVDDIVYRLWREKFGYTVEF